MLVCFFEHIIFTAGVSKSTLGIDRKDGSLKSVKANAILDSSHLVLKSRDITLDSGHDSQLKT